MQVNQSCINGLWAACTRPQPKEAYVHTYLQLQLHIVSYNITNDHSLLKLVIIGSLEQR